MSFSIINTFSAAKPNAIYKMGAIYTKFSQIDGHFYESQS